MHSVRVFRFTSLSSLFYVRVLTFSFIVLLTIIGTSAGAAQTGKATVEKLVTLFKSWDQGVPPAKVFSEATDYIDYSSMAEQALGVDQWSKLNEKDKNAFAAAIKKLVEQRYYPRWHKLFAKGSLTYGGESSKNGDITLNTILNVNKKSQDVAWRLNSKSAAPKVISLRVDEKDLLNVLHQRISPKLKKAGFPALLSWLQNKAAQEDN
ncbi:MAG TPA: ABC transporter substrate-binding protein [Oculatellaceae cyanobacterium]